jgi:hypothetical protein
MTTLAQARALALGLPGAQERDHHGRPSFRVEGRIFATLWDARHMNVMIDAPGIHTYVERDPAVYSEVWWDKRLAAVRVALERVDGDALGALLCEAWEGKAGRAVGG